MAALKDTHRGERCFIIGNGPSLSRLISACCAMNMTIGMNRIYLMFPELGFPTSYYLSVNDLVIEQCAADIQELTMPRFVILAGAPLACSPPDLYFLHTTYTGPNLPADAPARLWEGATVTYSALQVAFYLGFQKVDSHRRGPQFRHPGQAQHHRGLAGR